MPSDTDVANAALRLIGASRITSFTDGSKNANAVQDVYAGLRDDLLRSHLWNFATKRLKLARSSTAPAFQFSYAYALPADWLRTQGVFDNDAGVGTLVFSEEQVADQRCILCDAEDAYLVYIAKVTDPNIMPADFVRALEFSLARDLALPVASSASIGEAMDGHAKQKIAWARSADAAGSFPRQRPRGSWATSRGGGLNGCFWPR